MISPAETAATSLDHELARLRGENGQLLIEKRILELKVQKLQRQLWDRKSERMEPAQDGQKLLFDEPAARSPASEEPAAVSKRAEGPREPRKPKGPKPLDPSLPREVIAVPAPDLEKLICPATGQPMKPGFVEEIEVLARRAPQYYVKRYERTVFVSPAKTAPVYSPWPAEVLPRARVHASIVAHVAAAHYCEHLPYHRIERQLERVGVELPRNCQVSLMQQLDRMVEPLMQALKREVFATDYINVDATPIDQRDPARPGRVREATLWAYRARNGLVWFEHRESKSPRHPDATLREMNFSGFCQSDGAGGLNNIGPPGKVVSLGCMAHCRRGFFEAEKIGDPRAKWYLATIGKLFRVERIARRYNLALARKARLRERFSVPIFQSLIARAETDGKAALAKTDLGDAVRYTLNQKQRLELCFTHPDVEISNNAVERAIRPLKLGARNWLFIGHPKAGPRLANLFTLVENCRQAGIDAERYLIDIISRLGDHAAARIAELLPHHWGKGS